MSRSIKKPYVTDQNRGKPKHGKDKRIANKAVRKEDAANGSSYKKLSNSWNIRDYSFHVPTNPKAYRK